MRGGSAGFLPLLAVVSLCLGAFGAVSAQAEPSAQPPEPQSSATAKPAPPEAPILTVVGMPWLDYGQKINPFFAESVLRTLALDLAVRWQVEVRYCDERYESSLPADRYPRLRAEKADAANIPAMGARSHGLRFYLEVARDQRKDLFVISADDTTFSAVEMILQSVTATRTAELATALGLAGKPLAAEPWLGAATPWVSPLAEADGLAAQAAAEAVTVLLRESPRSAELRERSLWINITLAALYPRPYLQDRSKWVSRLMAEFAVLRSLGDKDRPAPELRAWLTWACGYPAEALSQLAQVVPAETRKADGSLDPLKLGASLRALYVFATHDWRPIDQIKAPTGIERWAWIEAMMLCNLPETRWGKEALAFAKSHPTSLPTPFSYEEGVSFGRQVTEFALPIEEANLVTWLSGTLTLADADRATLLGPVCARTRSEKPKNKTEAQQLVKLWFQDALVAEDTPGALEAHATAVRGILDSLCQRQTWPGRGTTVVPVEEYAAYCQGRIWEAMERRLRLVQKSWGVSELASAICGAWQKPMKGSDLGPGLALFTMGHEGPADQKAFADMLAAYFKTRAGSQIAAVCRVEKVIVYGSAETVQADQLTRDAAELYDARSANEMDAATIEYAIRSCDRQRDDYVKTSAVRDPWSRGAPCVESLDTDSLKPLLEATRRMPYCLDVLRSAMRIGTRFRHFDGLEEVAARMSALVPEDDESAWQMSEVYRRQGNRQKQIERLIKYCGGGPLTVSRANRMGRLARLLIDAGQPEEALRWARQGDKVGSAEPATAMGYALEALGKTAEAKAAFKANAERYEGEIEEYVHFMLRQKTPVAEVVRDCEQLLADHGDPLDSHVAVAMALIRSGWIADSRTYDSKHCRSDSRDVTNELLRSFYEGDMARALELALKVPEGTTPRTTYVWLYAYMAGLTGGDQAGIDRCTKELWNLVMDIPYRDGVYVARNPSKQQDYIEAAPSEMGQVVAACVAGWQQEFLSKDLEKAKGYYRLAAFHWEAATNFRWLARSRLLALGETDKRLMAEEYCPAALKTLREGATKAK